MVYLGGLTASVNSTMMSYPRYAWHVSRFNVSYPVKKKAEGERPNDSVTFITRNDKESEDDSTA